MRQDNQPTRPKFIIQSLLSYIILAEATEQREESVLFLSLSFSFSCSTSEKQQTQPLNTASHKQQQQQQANDDDDDNISRLHLNAAKEEAARVPLCVLPEATPAPNT